MDLNFSSMADLVSSSAVAAPALSGWCSKADFLYAAVQHERSLPEDGRLAGKDSSSCLR